MAVRWLRASLRVVLGLTAYDTRLEQVGALQTQGLIAAASIAAAAAEADAVFTILPSLESVETAILGTGGLIDDRAAELHCDPDEHGLAKSDSPSRRCRGRQRRLGFSTRR